MFYKYSRATCRHFYANKFLSDTSLRNTSDFVTLSQAQTLFMMTVVLFIIAIIFTSGAKVRAFRNSVHAANALEAADKACRFFFGLFDLPPNCISPTWFQFMQGYLAESVLCLGLNCLVISGLVLATWLKNPVLFGAPDEVVGTWIMLWMGTSVCYLVTVPDESLFSEWYWAIPFALLLAVPCFASCFYLWNYIQIEGFINCCRACWTTPNRDE
jgi:hypothetical protein